TGDLGVVEAATAGAGVPRGRAPLGPATGDVDARTADCVLTRRAIPRVGSEASATRHATVTRTPPRPRSLGRADRTDRVALAALATGRSAAEGRRAPANEPSLVAACAGRSGGCCWMMITGGSRFAGRP